MDSAAGVFRQGSQSISLLGSPSQLLLDSTQLAVDLDRHDAGAACVNEDEVDQATHRTVHRHLGCDPPPGVEGGHQRIADGELQVISDPRSGVRKEADRQVGTKGRGNCHQSLDARLSASRLDARHVRGVQTRGSRDRCLRPARVLAHVPDLSAEPPQQVTALRPEATLVHDWRAQACQSTESVSTAAYPRSRALWTPADAAT
jgi:hypothetical protein